MKHFKTVASALLLCLVCSRSDAFSLPAIKIGSGQSYASLAASASSSSPSIAPASSSSSLPFSLPAIRLGSKVGSSSSSSSSGGALSSFSLPAIKIGSKATIGGFGGSSSKMMMQTISKMESYAAGNGYRPSYGMSSSIRPRPFYPVPMGSMRRPIYRMPPYIPMDRMRMAPSMRMPMYMPRPSFGMRPFRPSMRSPMAAGSMASFSSRPRVGGMGAGMGGLSAMSAMDGMSGFGGSFGSMGDMSSLAGLGDTSDFSSSGSEGLFDSAGDMSSAFSAPSDADEYKMNGEGEEYKLGGDDDDKSEYSMETDAVAGEEGGSLDASKLGDGASMTLDDSSRMRVKNSNIATANGDDNDDDDATVDDTSLSTGGDAGMSDDEDEASGKLKGSLETTSTDDLMPHLPVLSGSSKKSAGRSNKKVSRAKKSKGKKLNYKAMYEVLKAYNDEKREAANHYNSGDSDDNNSEYVTMYRNQAAVVVDDDDEQAKSHRQQLPPKSKRGESHERKENQAHVINPVNGKKLVRSKVKATVDNADESDKFTPKPLHVNQEESIPSDAPQGYERPLYPPSQAYIAPISTESSSQSPPQQAPQTQASPAPVVYQSPAPAAIATIPYQLTPQVQPIEYVPVRSRRVKTRPEIIEEDDDEVDEYAPKRRARKVVYVIRKAKKQTPTYTEEEDGEEDDSEGSTARRSRAKSSSGRRSSASQRHVYKQKFHQQQDSDDESIDESNHSLSLSTYGRPSLGESRIRPLIVKVKDPFVQAAELASFVSAVTRNLPIATPRSSSPAATFFPAVSDPTASFTNTYIQTAGSPILEAPAAAAFPSAPVPFHTQLQPVAFYRNHVPATPITYSVSAVPVASIAHPSLQVPLVTGQVSSVASVSSVPAASVTSTQGDKMKLERRSLIPVLGEQVFENTKDLAAKAVESVESSIRSVVEGGFIGKKSNTGVSVPEAKSGVFGSIRKAISDALARNHEVSGEIVKAKERRKIDEIVKVVDHASANPSNKVHVHKQIQPLLKLASDPAIASFAETLSPAPLLPVATSPVMPLPVDALESSELHQLYPFKRSSSVSDSTSETKDKSTGDVPASTESSSSHSESSEQTDPSQQPQV